MKTYNLQPETVKVMKNGMLRIGQDLLGVLAGRRDLVFDMRFEDDGTWVIHPSTTGPGWPATYSSAQSKSPLVSIAMFFRIHKRHRPKWGTTIRCSKKRGGGIVVELPGNGHKKT